MELWFTEQEQDRLRLSLKVENVLFRGVSEFQAVEVLETAAYGRMLVLDGCVMCTDRDEFVYHEMIAHIPALLHAAPKKVVVIGGGDGGTVRELLKHKAVEKIVLCEIDAMVVDSARKYFPALASGLADPRVEVRIGDGVAYMRELENEVDIVVVDSTDPIGPGEGLFSGEFYRSVARSLRKGGIMVAQSESPWYERDALIRIHKNISAGFAHRYSYVGSIPTYPRGLWSWTMASATPLDPESLRKPSARFERISRGLKYLTPGLAAGAFDLPPFYREKIEF
jgi:spermidine synthase